MNSGRAVIGEARQAAEIPNKLDVLGWLSRLQSLWLDADIYVRV